jgi:hypothetical protein
MYKLLKLLGALAVVISSTQYAAADTLIQEDFVFSYNTTSNFTLSQLSYSYSGGPNLLNIAPYTFPGGGIVLAGKSQISEIITVDTSKGPYSADYSVTGFTGTGTFGVAVSPVPLPASFPLFVMALLGLGLFGYHTTRTNQTTGTNALIAV